MSEDENVKPSEVKKMPKQSVIKDLLKHGRSATKDSAEIAGAYGQKVADAVEKHGVHRKALAITRGLDRMTPEKLADCLDHLEYYLDVSGLTDRAKSAERLPMGDKPGEEDDEHMEGATEATKSARRGARNKNVQPFPAPVGAQSD